MGGCWVGWGGFTLGIRVCGDVSNRSLRVGGLDVKDGMGRRGVAARGLVEANRGVETGGGAEDGKGDAREGEGGAGEGEGGAREGEGGAGHGAGEGGTGGREELAWSSGGGGDGIGTVNETNSIVSYGLPYPASSSSPISPVLSSSGTSWLYADGPAHTRLIELHEAPPSVLRYTSSSWRDDCELGYEA